MSDAPLTFVTLVGSLRRGSYNAALARTLPALAPDGVTITHAPSLDDIPLYDADIQEADGFPAKVQAIADAIRAADGVIFVTPEYNYSISGVLKNAIDWLSRMKDQPFADKPYAIQSASMGGGGGARAQVHLRQIMVFLKGIAFNTPEVLVGAAHTKFDDDLQLTDEPTREFVGKQLAAFTEFARRVG